MARGTMYELQREKDFLNQLQEEELYEHADIAKRNLSLMGTKKGNIVRTIAIFAKDSEVIKMKNKSCENEKKYYGTMIVAYQLLKQKIITTEEFKQIGELYQNKYKISSPLLINISLQHSVVCD